MDTSRSQKLAGMIAAGSTVVMPDAYDAISARIIERLGFSAVQCSGHSFAIANCYKKEVDVPFSVNLSITRSIVEAVQVPVMADGEDGFGDGEELKANIRAYVEAGVAGANIEDQDLRSGSRGVIEESRMLEKIRCVREAAVEAGNPCFFLNARTDALAVLDNREAGKKEAVGRANRYLEAGANLVFVVNIKTLDEVRFFAKEINGPLSVAAGLPYNIQEFSIRDCRELGVARVSLPTIAILSTVQALFETLRTVQATEEFSEVVAEGRVLSDMKLLQDLLA